MSISKYSNNNNAAIQGKSSPGKNKAPYRIQITAPKKSVSQKKNKNAPTQELSTKAIFESFEPISHFLSYNNILKLGLVCKTLSYRTLSVYTEKATTHLIRLGAIVSEVCQEVPPIWSNDLFSKSENKTDVNKDCVNYAINNLRLLNRKNSELKTIQKKAITLPSYLQNIVLNELDTRDWENSLPFLDAIKKVHDQLPLAESLKLGFLNMRNVEMGYVLTNRLIANTHCYSDLEIRQMRAHFFQKLIDAGELEVALRYANRLKGNERIYAHEDIFFSLCYINKDFRNALKLAGKLDSDEDRFRLLIHLFCSQIDHGQKVDLETIEWVMNRLAINNLTNPDEEVEVQLGCKLCWTLIKALAKQTDSAKQTNSERRTINDLLKLMNDYKRVFHLISENDQKDIFNALKKLKRKTVRRQEESALTAVKAIDSMLLDLFTQNSSKPHL